MTTYQITLRCCGNNYIYDHLNDKWRDQARYDGENSNYDTREAAEADLMFARRAWGEESTGYNTIGIDPCEVEDNEV